jgi:creatinine amidohydrolase
MMYLAPEVTRPLSEAGSGKARQSRLRGVREGWAWTPRRWTEVTADTGIGNPAKATKEKGEEYVNAAVGQIAQYFTELAAIDPKELYE